jgi:hypothetical protein
MPKDHRSEFGTGLMVTGFLHFGNLRNSIAEFQNVRVNRRAEGIWALQIHQRRSARGLQNFIREKISGYFRNLP